MLVVLKRAAGVAVGLAALGGVARAEEASTIGDAITGGELIFELRPRYEHVDQTGIADADALTNRTRLGWKTGTYHGFTGLIELEDVRAIVDDYNDGIPPAEPFATIGDPETTELNRLQLAWRANAHFTATLGRQNVQFDDQRFIDGSNSRQDARTLDALRADVTFGDLKGSYLYVDQVNNTADDFTDLDTESHLLNVTNKFDDAFSLTGFIYAFDFTTPTAINQSSEFMGVRASGKVEAMDTEFSYALSYANQQDYGSSLVDFNLDYGMANLTATHGQWSGRLQYETLEGDGVRGLFFPIGSNTSFHGWAGAFSTKPANGLNDFNASVTYSPGWDAPLIGDLAFTARWYEFEAERTGVDLGEELDFEIAGDLTDKLGLLIRSGDYRRGDAGSPVERRRFWVELTYKL
ncbi:hypothetical protein U91I_02279 [alpha proteobacterium U9-1i]|nr:hypothetical protein U91I_02279 [alpha proteobacterium U9-1i]